MSKVSVTAGTTLQFATFWEWLTKHPNCILRAGTGESALFDHDDFHWTILTEDEGLHVVRLGRAKDVVGEVLVIPHEISYVQCEPGEEGDWSFECIVEGLSDRHVAYHFLLSHGYEEEEHKPDKWTH